MGEEEFLHLLLLEVAHIAEYHCLLLLLSEHTLLHAELLLHCLTLLVLLQQRLHRLQVQMLGERKHSEEELVVDEDNGFAVFLHRERGTARGARWVLREAK